MKLRSLVLAQMVMFHTAQWSPDGTQVLITRLGEGHTTHGYIFDFGRDELRALTVARFQQLEREWIGARGKSLVSEQQTANGQAIVLGSPSAGRSKVVSRERWAEQPGLSPGGRSIVYEGREDPHDVLSSWIVVVDTSGANPKRLHRGTDPSWSPDGQRIAFKTSVNGVLHITTISAAGGVAAVLTPGVHPAWSPDGRRLSYLVEGLARFDIWIMNADGSAKRCLTCSVRDGK